MMKKFMISMDESVFEILDNFSKKKHVNRSAVITLAVQQYIDAQYKIPEVENQLNNLSELMPFLKTEIVQELKGKLEDVKLKD